MQVLIESENFPELSNNNNNLQVSRENIRSAGDRAFLVSREMDGTTRPRCMSFWFFMYEPIVDTTGHFIKVFYRYD